MNLINMEDRGIVERILKRLKDKKDATNKYGNRKDEDDEHNPIDDNIILAIDQAKSREFKPLAIEAEKSESNE